MAYLTSIPYGFAGRNTRLFSGDLTESTAITATNPPTVFGDAVKLDATGVHPIDAGDTTASVYGVLMSSFPSQGTLATGEVVSIKRTGYISVPTYGSATPAVNGIVYVRTVIGSASEPVGSFSTVADGTNTFILTNAHFTGGKDSNGNAEIFINALK